MIERKLKENTQTWGISENFEEGYGKKKENEKKRKLKLPSLKDKSKVKEGERLSSL